MICEMYIDDCTVFGDTNIEFVSTLKLIFERFRKHNLYIKASKCFFGFSELEFVGKVVSEKGLQTSRTKSATLSYHVITLFIPFHDVSLPHFHTMS